MENGSVSIISNKFFNWLSELSAGNLEDQVKSMEKEVMLMRALLEDFQATEKPSRRLKVWLEEIRGIADDAEGVIKTYSERSQKDLSNYEDMMIRNKIANDISRVMNKIRDVSERREASNSIFHSLCQRRPPPNIIGFDDDVCAIKKRLLTDDRYCCIISILGEEGTGKTTLAKLIYNDIEVMDHFPFRAWISVPQENSDRAVLQDIQKQVMDYLRQKGKWNMEEEPLAALDGRYLIILDDIRKAQVLDFLRNAFPDKLPNEEESWSLFTGTLKVEIPPELEDIGKKIVRSCGRVRRNIIRMGNLLSKNSVTYENWSRFQIVPVDFEIPARRLITLWVAEGFVNKRMDDEPPEHIARRYLKDLIDKEMVQVVKEKFDGGVTCRLSKEGAKFLQDYAEATSAFSSSIHGPRRFADHYNHKDFHFQHIHGDDSDAPLGSQYTDVLSFLSFDHRKGSKPGEDVRKFLHRCISSKCFLLLRVLDLERVFRPKFPKVFDKLLQLRYLGLRWTYLEELPPFVSNLLKLQTLDVKHTYISTLPHSIWKMQRLRHLYLSESYRSRFEPKPSSSSLRELQTLWGVFIDEESPVKNGLKTLLNLRKLGLACRIMLSQKKQMLSQIEAVADWILELKDLQSLRLRSFDELGEPWYLPLKDLSKLKSLSSMYLLGRLKFEFVKSGIPESLTYLTLSASRLKIDPMHMLQHLHNLKKLRLFSDSFVGKTMCCSSGIFPHLQVLKLWNLEHLETSNMTKGALPELTDLEIRSCRQLKMLPKEVQCMKNLKILRLTDMLFQKSMHCYSGSFPQLLVLKLENLKHLQIWTVAKSALPKLSHLEIKSCSQLRMLPKGLQHMRNLKIFRVKNMPQEFTYRIEENQGLDWYKIAVDPYFVTSYLW
ncbi:probable disease resistance protein RF9 [Hevea brasiliensis]|nr:probable disease resistance protein RF9 [Hevea brasiliensis]